MLSLHEIQQIQIELTTRCNARCPMCMRNYRGMDYNSGYPDAELTLAHIQHILSPEFLQQIVQVRFNGNLGDFATAQDALPIAHWLRDQGVGVYVNTNGSLRTSDWWARLAKLGVTVGFALDGMADTHALYRQGTCWHTVIQHARAFIDAGGQAIWRFIPFDHNQHQLEACRQLSQDMGFVSFENIDEGRNCGPVYTRAGQFSHWLGQPYAGQISMAPPKVQDLVASHVTWFDPRTVKCHRDTVPLVINCHHKRAKELYIAADGSVYPCCYLGFYPDRMHHPGNSQLQGLVKENNALEHSLEHCVKWFDVVEETWSKDSIAEGRLYACVNSCGGRSI